jgi:hypothetical protein
MEKKGQGLSMNAIIIAALALLVLVVLAIIFMGQMGGNATDLRKCESIGGKCVEDRQCPAGWSKTTLSNVACLDSDGKADKVNQQCCTVGEN